MSLLGRKRFFPETAAVKSHILLRHKQRLEDGEAEIRRVNKDKNNQ